MKGERKKSKEENKKKIALHNTKGTSIEQRPKYIKLREMYGHWEMDTVIGGKNKGKACLLVLSERMTREEIHNLAKIKTEGGKIDYQFTIPKWARVSIMTATSFIVVASLIYIVPILIGWITTLIN